MPLPIQLLKSSTIAFSVLLPVIMTSNSLMAQSSRKIIEETDRRIHDYCSQGVLNCGQGSNYRYDPVEEAFGNAFGALLGAWLREKTSVGKTRNRATDVPSCLREFSNNTYQYTRDAKPWLPSFHMPKSERWIAIYNRKDLIEAVTVGCLTAKSFAAAQVLKTADGSYQIVVGTVPKRNGRRILNKFITKGSIPQNSFMTDGAEFVDRVWASPNIVHLEAQNAPNQ